MFLTDHRLGIYTNDFSPDPTGQGVLSSITITSRKAGIDELKFSPDNTLWNSSLGRKLSAAHNVIHLTSQLHHPLHPKG